jgi:S1-C subfamily serine protease
LIDGTCPSDPRHNPQPPFVSDITDQLTGTRPRRRRRWSRVALVTALVAFALVALAVGGVAVDRSNRADRRDRAALAALTKQVEGTRTGIQDAIDRLDALQHELDEHPSAVDVVKKVHRSIFTVFAGRAEGSTFVVARKGHTSFLVTNYHVVSGAWEAGNRSVTVDTGNRTIPGTIVKVQPDADLALISVHGKFAPLIRAGGKPAVGEPVIVVGSPFGYKGTVTSGIVSANRATLIQFSAPVSPGSSGGPLLDERGEVLGITRLKVEGTGAEGLSFAIPVSELCKVLISC